MKKIFVLLFFMVLSCSKEKDTLVVFKEFPLEYKLTSKPLEKLITHGASLDLYDTLLICCNTYDSKYFVRIYNKNTLKLYKKFLRRGDGPYEMKYAGRLSIDHKNKSIWIADYFHNRLWGYNIDSLLMGNIDTPSTIVNLPSKVYPIIEFHCYDSVFYLPDLTGGTGMIVFNNQGIQIKRMTDYKLVDRNNIDGSGLNYTLSNIFPEREKIITVYRYFDKMIIRDLNGNILKIIFGPDQLKYDDQLSSDDLHRIEAYFPYYPRVYNDLIFAEYNGNAGMHYNKEIGTLEPVYGNNINVFRFDGEPVARLHLDHQIISFVIDSTNARIIAFAADTDSSIIEYDLKKITNIFSN